jgi:hypothetical protein
MHTLAFLCGLKNLFSNVWVKMDKGINVFKWKVNKYYLFIACKNKDFIVDYEKSGKSLSLHYGLYCEGIEKFQKTVLFC